MKNLLRIKISILFLIIILTGCDTFDPGNVRDNPNDPGNKEFIPDQPSDISVIKSADQITVRWADNTDFEDGYVIRQSIDDTTDYEEIVRLKPDSEIFEYTLSKSGLVLNIQVEAFINRETNQPDSVLQELSKSIPLIDVKNLQIFFPKENLVKITWQAPLEVETGYKIFLKPEDKSFTEIGEVENDGIAEQQFQTEYTLKNSTTYTAKVVPIKNSFIGQSKTSRNNTFYKPHAPENLNITPVSESSLKLSWTVVDNQLPEPAQFLIERKNNAHSYKEIARINATQTNFQDNDLDTNNTYEYRIKSLTSNYTNKKAAYATKPQNIRSLLNKSRITDIELNPSNSDIALIFYDYQTFGNNIRHSGIWNLDTNNKKIDLGTIVESIEYNSTGSKIVVTNFDSAKIYDSITGNLLFSHSEESNTYFDASFSSDDKHVAFVGSDLTLWDPNNYALLNKYTQFDLITGVEFNPVNSDELAFTTHTSPQVYIVNALSGEIKFIIETPEDVTSFSYSRNGDYIATFLSKKFILWNTYTGELIKEWELDERIFFPSESEGIQFLKNNKILVGDYLLDISSGQKERLDFGDSKPYDFPSEILFTTDEEHIFTAYESIEIWEFIEGWYPTN